MEKTAEQIYIWPLGDLEVQVLSYQWAGGGQNYEYLISRRGKPLFESADDWGSASACAATAFGKALSVLNDELS